MPGLCKSLAMLSLNASTLRIQERCAARWSLFAPAISQQALWRTQAQRQDPRCTSLRAWVCVGGRHLGALHTRVCVKEARFIKRGPELRCLPWIAALHSPEGRRGEVGARWQQGEHGELGAWGSGVGVGAQAARGRIVRFGRALLLVNRSLLGEGLGNPLIDKQSWKARARRSCNHAGSNPPTPGHSPQPLHPKPETRNPKT